MTILARLREEFSFISGNILVLTITLIIIISAGAIPYTYYPKYVEGLGGTPFIVGVIGFASYATLALVQFPGGYLADKHGRRWLIVIMTFGTAVTYVFYAAAPTWHFILVAAVLQSLCLIYQPALLALVADSMPPEKRGMGFSIINLVHYVSVPSPIIAGLLSIRYGLIFGMRIAYLIVAASFLIGAVIRIRLRETLGSRTERIPLVESFRAFPDSVSESLRALKTVSRSMLFLFVSFAFYNFAWFACSLNLIFYATDVLHIEEFEWAVLMMWFSAVGILSALPCGKIIDKFGRKKSLSVGWFLFIPAMIAFVYGNLIVLSICFLLLGVALILVNTAYPALEADLVAREKRGKIAGSTYFFYYVMNSLGQLSGGFMYQYLSPALPFLLSSTLYVPCLLLTLFSVHEPTKREI
ncbi:MFS transporter [Candidatus Bathyarchaeota archaeon]|nr:MFS transporter [Candidatus Bathyarchaeota archaeon]